MSDAAESLTNVSELLHRQVHPQFVQANGLSSQAFTPFPRDDGKLSVDRNSLSSAQEAYALHIRKVDPKRQTNLESAGTWSVTVGECRDLKLPVLADPVEGAEPNPAHCLIDFHQHSHNQRKRCGKKLRDKAVERGQTYNPKMPQK